MSTPGNQPSPAQSNVQYSYNGMAEFPLPQNNGGSSFNPQQQQFMSNMDVSSSFGVHGGGGDPGPASLAQQQQQQQQQQQNPGFRPQYQQQPSMNPQQMAMFQQYSQAAQGQNGQGRQFTPQQLQMAMASMQAQSQAGHANSQALMAAMRAGQGVANLSASGMQQQQLLPQRPPGGPTGNYGQTSQIPQAAQQQQHPNPAQLAFQQQRMQQLMQQQGMQARPAPGSPARPPPQQSGSMPPPPLPGTPQQYHQQGNYPAPQMSNQPPQQQTGQFHLSQQQQQTLIAQRQNLLNNPSFQALPIQQQQAYMQTQQQQFLQMVAAQTGQLPPPHAQPPPHQQPPPQQSVQYMQPQSSPHQPHQPAPHMSDPAQGMNDSAEQGGSIPRQPTPQQVGTPRSTHAQTPQQPMSSLPQHMAPPRPASAASQRAPSPHPGMMPGSPAVVSISTPPPSGPMYPVGTPMGNKVPSPTLSSHSHHSQIHQTPQPQPNPPGQSSPSLPARTPTPSQVQHNQHTSGPSSVGINGQAPIPPQYASQYQGMQNQPPPGASPHNTLQTHQNAPQSMPQTYGQVDTPAQQPTATTPNYPPPPQPMVPTMENLTPQQQQQMASAMTFFSQAAQQQQQHQNQGGDVNASSAAQGQGTVRPNVPTMAARPPQYPATPTHNINTSDFPFDPRLLSQLPFLNDPRWRTTMQAQNPQMLAAVQQAAALMPSVRPDVIQRMQQVLFHTAKIQQQGRPPNGAQPSTPIQQYPPATDPSQSQNAIPAAQQARIWAAQQAQAQGSPAMPSPAIRPPPPHLPPSSGTNDSPNSHHANAVGRPPGSTTKPKKGDPPVLAHQQQAMPPPKFIPAHVGPQRPPPHTAPGEVPPPVATAPIPAPNLLPVKEWESALRVDVPITRITPLPVNEIDESTDPTFKSQLPAMTEGEKKQVRTWLDKDVAFFESEKEHYKRNLEKNIKWAQAEDRETPWWMLRKGETRAPAPTRLRILWPADKDRMRAERTHQGRRQIKYTQADFKAMANVEDHIVPVRLELEHDVHKLKDTFMWNCADKVVTPELFAQTLCDDFALPLVHFGPKIVAAINERIREYQDQVLPILHRRPAGDTSRGKLDAEGDAESKALVEVFRRAREAAYIKDEESTNDAAEDRLDVEGRQGSPPEEEIKTDPGDGMLDDDVKIVSLSNETHDQEDEDEDDWDRPMTVEEAMACLPAEQTEELRILIKVDIIVGTQNLSDSFEWDLNSSVTPEEFAASYVTELGLSLEFATAITHDIHEQVLVHKRSLFLVGHTFGSGIVPDDEVRSAFLPPVTTTVRREDIAMSLFTPIFNEMREEDIAHLEAARDKEAKRKKRAGRARRGVVLPDREPLKTQRSLLNNFGPNGLPILTNTETASVANTNHFALTKRKAALDAQANINLLAQDLPIPQPASPAPMSAYSSRGRKPGRGRGGYSHSHFSRASPASDAFREGSISHLEGIATPSVPPMIGVKRSFREDSFDTSSVNGGYNGAYSPLPSRKRGNHSRIPDSPDEPPTPARMELPRASSYDELDANLDGDPAIGWHCLHCGVPEYLAQKVKKDKEGNKVSCYQCADYKVRKGTERPCEYKEDERFHRERLMRRKGGIPPPPAGSPLSSFSAAVPPPMPAIPSVLAAPGPAPSPSHQPNLNLARLKSESVPVSIASASASASASGRGRSRTRSRSTTATSASRSPIKARSRSNRSPSRSDSDDDDSDSTFSSSRDRSRGSTKKQLQAASTTAALPQTPARSTAPLGLGKSPIAGSPSSGKKPAVELPRWIHNALAGMRAKYPRDEFAVVQKPRAPDAPPGPVEWRAKCLDCPGKIYSLGPGESLNNFEVHLKNRQHTANRLAREEKR